MNRLLVALLGACLCRAALAQLPAPIVSFTGTTIRVENVTPRSDVLVFGVARVPNAETYLTTVKNWRSVTSDSDQDGVVVFDLGEPVPLFSVWAIIDLTNRQFTIAGPSGYPPRIVDPPARLFQRGTLKTDVISVDRAYLDLLYVEPNGTSWHWHDLDGTATDRDGRNERTTVAASQGKRIAGVSQALDEIVPGGILVAIDFMRLDIFASRVQSSQVGGGQ